MSRSFASIRLLATAVMVLSVAALLLTAVPAAATPAAGTARPTVQSFRLQLRAAAATDAGAADTLAAFQRLSAREQARFVSLLADERSLEALVDAADTQMLAATALHDGDVTIVSETSAVLEDSAGGDVTVAALPAGTWRSTYTVSQKILGITITKLSVWVRYETNGSRITRVLNSGSGVSNYNFVVSISQTNASPWLSSGRAWAETVWHGSLIYKGFGIRLDKRQTMSADNNGTVRGSLVNI